MRSKEKALVSYKDFDSNGEYLREWRIANYRKSVLNSVKARAKKSGVVFNLTLDDIPPVPEFCPIFGIPLKVGKGRSEPDSPSLDRIIPEKGYVKGNVVWLSMRANAMKNNGTAEEHRKIANWIDEMVAIMGE